MRPWGDIEHALANGSLLELLLADALHQLKGLDPAAGLALGAGQQFDRGGGVVEGLRVMAKGDHGSGGRV